MRLRDEIRLEFIHAPVRGLVILNSVETEFKQFVATTTALPRHKLETLSCV